MSDELTTFFVIVMTDLDQREAMYERAIASRGGQSEIYEKMLGQTQSIKQLMTNRARQFGLTVADDQKYLERIHQIGISASDYKNLPSLNIGVLP